MRPIKIALGHLRHRTSGSHSVFMPINIGYIASYALTHLGPEAVEIRLYDNPNIILKDIQTWRPEVVGLSNYCWNSEVSKLVFRHAKKIIPEVICISGGPEFPIDHSECLVYLKKKPEIDFYVYFESELSFSRLIKKFLEGKKVSYLKNTPQEGAMSIHTQTGDLVFEKPIARLMNMDEIPSPYLNGLMDQWFNGCYAPSIETARGCPFSCGFCFTGQFWFNQLATFSTDRIKKELSYITQRMSKYPEVLLSICDSNFGMYKRDEDIAIHIRSLQDKYGWPNAFDVTTGKSNYDRILKIAEILKNKMLVTCSVQSLNEKTLEVIKRKNISLDEYQRINSEIKKRGMISVAELIAPLPEETKQSFFETSSSVVNAGVERIAQYTTMLLKGTYLASKECREKYRMQTKFRILPRQFGEYLGEKCFEIEEVCVATNTLLFDDYLEIRGFSLVSSFFSSEQFDLIHKHLQELKINTYDFLYHLWELIKSGKTELSEIYNCFIQETKEELWNSPGEIYNYFTKEENYKKLLNAELGDNLLRKYKTKILLERCIGAINLAYKVLKKIGGCLITDEFNKSLDSARIWMIAIRDVNTVFRSKINVDQTLCLPYDVNAWYLEKTDSKPLTTYNTPSRYRVFYKTDGFNTMLGESKKLYAGDLYFQVSKLLINWSIKNFWLQCELLEKQQ